MAATSKCIKCGGISFEVVVTEPTHSKWKLIFVQCSSCGGVVGVIDFHNIGALLFKLAEKLGFKL